MKANRFSIDWQAGLLAVISALTLISWQASAQDVVTWRGASTQALYDLLGPLREIGDDETIPHDLAPFSDAGELLVPGASYSPPYTTADPLPDHYLWLPARIPGAGETALFHFDTKNSAAWGNVTIDEGDFAPDHMIIRAVGSGYPIRSSDARVVLNKNLTLKTLELDTGYSPNVGGNGNLLVPGGYSLTLTDEKPLAFKGYRGSWASIELEEDASLVFDGAEFTFEEYNTFYTHNYHGPQGFRPVDGSGGFIDFITPDSIVNLGDPDLAYEGSNTPAAIDCGGHRLRVRSDQTWNNSAAKNALITLNVTQNAVAPRMLIESIDGDLPDLSDISFKLRSTFTGNTVRGYIPGATYRSIGVETRGGSWHNALFNLTGDVTLIGGYPILDYDETNKRSGSVESNFGLYLRGQGQGYTFYLDGHELTVKKDVLLESGTHKDYSDRARINITDSIFNIEGNLYIDSPTRHAGASSEVRRAGLTGNFGVVNLYGNYSTTVRSMNADEGGMYLSTINLLGGTAEAPATFEVAANAEDELVAGTHSFGTVNIGKSDKPAHVLLVNEYLNDGTELDAEEKRIKDGEILLAGWLTIAADSSLDMNGNPVVVHFFDMAAGAELDLNTGLRFEHGDLVPGFFAYGNHAARWNTFAGQVIDSSNKGLRFEAYCDVPGVETPVGGTSQLDFDGDDDYVLIPGDGLADPRVAFTIEAWIKVDEDHTGWGDVTYRCRIASTASSIYWLGVEDSTGTLCYGAGVNGKTALGNTGVAVDDQWHHLAVTYDGADQHVYLDGELKASATIGALTNSRSSNRYGIGGSELSAGRHFNGSIVEVRYWDYARDASEIVATKDTPLIGNEDGLASYWPLTEGYGDVTLDRTVNQRVGTFQNGVYWEGGDSFTYWQAFQGRTLIIVR